MKFIKNEANAVGLSQIVLDRRQFLISTAVVAGGFALGISTVSAKSSAASVGPWGSDVNADNELSAWIEISEDNTVNFRVPTPEIGNGSATQVAMNIAEELACDWSRVTISFGSVKRDFVQKGAYKVGFLPFFGGHGTDKVRMKYALQLGASARERLKAAAAVRWDVPVSEVEARDSTLLHKNSGRHLRYGDVVVEAAKINLAAEPALKPESEWTFLGKASPPKLHIPEVTRGKAVFGIDVKVPGMVHAALRQSPVHGGKLKSHDPKAVLDMPGVRAVVVLDPAKTKGSPVQHKSTWGFDNNAVQSAVAVIADHYWQAKQALEALPIEWDTGSGSEWTSTNQIYEAAHAKLLDESNGKTLRKKGDVASVTGDKIVEAVYSTPYCDNATMEPLNGTALVSDDAVEVWCPTQDTLQAYWVAIDETGVAPEKVSVHQTYVGGGFGRRTMADDIRMVVAVAKEYPGVPVKTIWSREECFQQGRYRTPITTRFKAVLGNDGIPTALTSKVVFVGNHPLFQMTRGYDDQPYFLSGIIPNIYFSSDKLPLHVLNGAYRAPCYNSHVFFVETFIDECAVAAGIDPLEYRLKLLSKWDQSWSKCLRVAAEKAGWGKPLPKDEARGIAITNWPLAELHDAGTIICAAVRVKVSKDGTLAVKQVDIAFDCGKVANADAVRCQIEGGTIFGMNMTLNEQLTIKDGAIVENNFHQYPMLKFSDHIPKVNVHFDALSGHDRFDIVGEAPIGPVGPAIGNAIFQVTRKRLRSTPFRNHDLRWG